MRPRISRKEAEYIAEILKSNLKTIEEKKARIKTLHNQIFNLEYELKEDHLWRKELYQEKTEELEKLKIIEFSLWDHARAHERLLNKYSKMAEGTTPSREFKSINNIVLWDLPKRPKRIEELVV